MGSLAKLRSGRVHPGGDAAGEPASPTIAAGSASELPRAPSLRSLQSQKLLLRRASTLARRDADDAARGLLLPDDEHAAWVAGRVAGEARAAARALAAFYARMLVPVAVTAAYCFALAAGLSYSIPNLLCNRIAKENSVRRRRGGAAAAAVVRRLGQAVVWAVAGGARPAPPAELTRRLKLCRLLLAARAPRLAS